MRPRTRHEFGIAIICALPLEVNAILSLFDEHYDELGCIYGKQRGDANCYTTGRIGHHNVVLTNLPGMGKGCAASAASSMRVSFPEIKLALLIGICGGVPFTSQKSEIILGDVIISEGVIEYDIGRQYPNGFHRKADFGDGLGRPNRDIRTFLSSLKANKICHLQEKMSQYLKDLQQNQAGKYQYPGAAQDRLFEAVYRHKHHQQSPISKCICIDCKSGEDPVCDEALVNDCSMLGCMGKLVQRNRLHVETPELRIHIGIIASADTVMKSGEHRNKLSEKEGVIGFEMEGAGVWDNLPCVIIKGVCDYADSHKNKTWQNFAAATAASCTKAFLYYWTPTTLQIITPASWSTALQLNENAITATQLLLRDILSVPKTPNAIKNLREDFYNRLNASQWDNESTGVLEEVIEQLKTQLNNSKYPFNSEMRMSMLKPHQQMQSEIEKLEELLRVRGFPGKLDKFRSPTDQPNNLISPENVNGAIRFGLSKRIGETQVVIKESIEDSFTYLAELQRSQMLNQVQNWLGAITTENDYSNCRAMRLEDTCDWIADHPTFLCWKSHEFLTNKAKLLWLHGPPGFGKTVLCARLVETLSVEPRFILAHFFCSSEDEDQRNPLMIVRSWVWQAVCHSDAALNLAFDRSNAKGGRSASRSDIWDLLGSIARCNSQFTFVVDGLDECYRSILERRNLHVNSREDFLRRLKTAISGVACRILIVSRDEGDIRSQLFSESSETTGHTIYELSISKSDVHDDVMRYSAHIVAEKLPKKDKNLQKDLAIKIADRSDGMFLWVRLQRERLRGGKNSKQLHSIINETPANLEHLYERNWIEISNLPQHERCCAEAIFRWATFALRPLTVRELAEALAILNDDDVDDLQIDELPDQIDEEYINSEIIGPCSSLLEARTTGSDDAPGSRTVHLVHFTVREYLLSGMPKLSVPFSDCGYHNNHLAQLCLRYLQYKETWDPSGYSESEFRYHSFRTYAVDQWYQHIDAEASNYKEVDSIMRKFFSPTNEHWNRWRTEFESTNQQLQSFEVRRFKFKPGNRLYYASLFGLLDTVKFLQTWWMELDVVGGQYGTALQAACARGHVSVFDFLIECGADINTETGEFGSAINAAAASGKYVLVQHLVNLGASVTTRDPAGRTSIYLASKYGQHAVVRLLLENGADPSVASNSGWTPLNAAACNGYLEVVRLLVDRDAGLSVRSNDGGWTPLGSAVCRGHLEVVRLLLDSGADLSVTNNHGCTPLKLAATGGHLEIVRLLLNRGADPSVADSDGWAPLKSAASNGHLEVAQLLLDRGANLSVRSNDGWTPLKSAACNGHLEVARLLLDRGADLSVRSNDGWTPLKSAACNGHLEMVRLLLDRGADLSVRSNDGWTPLKSAACNGCLEVVRLLLDEGADLSVGSHDGWTPLKSAVSNGHLEVVRLLLDRGADPSVTGHSEWAPLNFAAIYGHLEVVRLLLDRGADLAVRSESGWTPLKSATSNGHLKVVQLLLERGADLSACDDAGWTPLSSAACNGHLEVVQLLVDWGADLSVTDRDGWTPLNLAANSGHLEVVRLLLNRGADLVSVADHDGWTPLKSAASNGHFEIVRLLLDNGADLSVRSKGGWTPLHSAASNGHLEVVQLLSDRGADLSVSNNAGWTPLNLAPCNDRLRLLTGRGADLSLAARDGWTPLNSAASNGHLDVVRMLLDRGADLSVADHDGSTPLNSAASNGHLEVVQLLLDRDADLSVADYDGWTPLNAAASDGHLGVVQLLLDRGAELSVTDYDGWTPLNSAASDGYLEIVRLLLDRGADLSVTNNFGWTPLNTATINDHIEVVQLLLDRGADTSVANNYGWSPLHAAAAKGHLGIIQSLVKSGAEINLLAIDQATPLHLAVQRGNIEAVAILLEYGAIPTSYDIYSRTPMDWADIHSMPVFRERITTLLSHQPINEYARRERTKRSIQTVADKLQQSQPMNRVLFNVLGHILLLLEDSSSASVAFGHAVTFDPVRDVCKHHTYCDMCNRMISDTRYVCKICAKTDLCQECMIKYNSGEREGAMWCIGHEFLYVPTITPRSEGTSPTPELPNIHLTEWVEKICVIHHPDEY